MNQEKIGKLIKKIRKDNNLTQKDLADSLGVTYQAVSKWENGKNIPDIEILNQISNIYNISIDSILNGESNNNTVKLINKKTIFIIVFVILVLVVLFISFNNNSSFEFKTITSSCDNFKISGSISYNNSKTSIFISNVNYCNGDDNNLYTEIDCSLYEDDGVNDNKISTCNYDKKEKITLEDYLKQVEFAVDDYKRTCNVYSNESLYLKINAKEADGKITSYKIPLSLVDSCDK